MLLPSSLRQLHRKDHQVRQSPVGCRRLFLTDFERAVRDYSVAIQLMFSINLLSSPQADVSSLYLIHWRFYRWRKWVNDDYELQSIDLGGRIFLYGLFLYVIHFSIKVSD